MLTPIFDHEFPEMTAEIAHVAFQKGNVVMKIRDTLGSIFKKEQISGMYPVIGQPTASPTEFRLRLLENEVEQMLLERILEGCAAAGLPKGKKKQRTDSTHVLANIRILNRSGKTGAKNNRSSLDLPGKRMRSI